MYIEELEEEGVCERGEKQLWVDLSRGTVVVSDTKRVLVGAGGRALFYPTLLYNVLRNKIQSEFRWWDRVDQFVLLGAVPFPADVPCLKELGVCGVVTLNEPYETLVPTSLYHAHGIDHLVIPTRDYLFAPSYGDICQAVNFVHENASRGKTTYVHCKAGRGRSTTIVICYLVEYKQMTPDSAYEYVRSIRPRVLLAPSQWQAVQDFYFYRTKKTPVSNVCTNIAAFDDGSVVVVTESDLDGYDSNHDSSVVGNVCTNMAAFDDGSVVVVTESDLDGYDSIHDSSVVGNDVLAKLSLACRVQFASQAAIARFSCSWLRRNEGDKMSREKLGSSVGPDQLGRVGVDIRVY